MRASLRLVRIIRDQIYAEGIERINELKRAMGISQDLELPVA